jgi:signal transduction histidine kinase
MLTLLRRSTLAMLNGSHLPITLHRLGEPRPISMAVYYTIFLIGREAAANVLHHSGASELTLTLHYCHKQVSLTIADKWFWYSKGSDKEGPAPAE